MDIRTQYVRYVRFCFRAGVKALHFVRFVTDVFPYTEFQATISFSDTRN